MKIWIVEDEAPQRMLLCDLVRQACGKHGVKADIVALESGESLTNAYQPGADLLLLDIDMPGINGMDTAHIIRQKDERVLIAFCTNLVSRALDGYAVAAMDFLVKPVTAARIDELLDKVFHRLSVAAPVTLTLHTQDNQHPDFRSVRHRQQRFRLERCGLCEYRRHRSGLRADQRPSGGRKRRRDHPVIKSLQKGLSS